MTRSDPPITNPLLGKAFLDSLPLQFPEEFENKPLTLQQQLKDMDQIIAVEQGFIGNIDEDLESVNVDEEYSAFKKKIVHKGRREGQELNFDTTDYRRLGDLEDED